MTVLYGLESMRIKKKKIRKLAFGNVRFLTFPIAFVMKYDLNMFSCDSFILSQYCICITGITLVCLPKCPFPDRPDQSLNNQYSSHFQNVSKLKLDVVIEQWGHCEISDSVSGAG